MTTADDFIAQAKAVGCYSFDIEHPPELDVSQDDFRLSGCSFATEGLSFYTESYGYVEGICKALFPLDLEAVAYNLKYDLKCLKKVGLITQYPALVVDPMIGVNLLDDNLRPNQLGLKIVRQTYLGRDERLSFKEAWAFGEHSEQFKTYAVDDAVDEFDLWKLIKPRLVKEGLLNLLIKVLGPASKVFADMELVGMGWDLVGAKRLLRGYQQLRDAYEHEILEELGPMNLGSGDQLAKRLFDDLGYDPDGIEMTPSGKRYSVDAEAMDILAKKFPVCNKIKLFRTADKILGTYVEPLTRRALADPKGRIHATFWLVSATGRTRCENPNLQNLPAYLPKEFDTLNIRNNIVPAPGMIMIVGDLSQIELRLVAHVSQDPLFLKAYLEWQCTKCGGKGSSKVILHQCPNCGQAENEKILKDPKIVGFWHGLDLHQMTTDKVPALLGDRQMGKKTNFALVYYATANRMHYEVPELSKGQWQKIIDQYFSDEVYIGVRAWHHRMERGMYDTGICTDIFGRRRRILKAEIKKNPKHALNSFINFGPQSSACAMMELAMARIREEFISMDMWEKDVYQTNMVHDEMVLECKDNPEIISKVSPVIIKHLENVVQLRVPCRTSLKFVDAWGKAK